MRLLNIHSYAFREFHGENIPPYLIASHRWCDDQTTFKDVLKKRNKESKGWQKVEGFCERAKRDNELLETFENATCCEWIWIDTACIDKKSSAEVSESINSMFEWYSKAQECHAYMADVKPFPESQQLSEVLDDFKHSEWFKRGWTLQELLAPRCVVFFTQTWQVIGHKCADCNGSQSCEGAGPLLNAIIAEVTGIPEEVLRNYERSKSIAVEEKMKWQMGRRTTKIEDQAYCLLGLFDVHMPLLYGEGAKAMLRLERTVLEELERPWQSQLRLSFNEPTDEPNDQSCNATKRVLRPGRPLAVMRKSNVDGEVFCICGYGDDDGYLIACDVCQYWQHAICYFPKVDYDSMSKDQEHRCVRCCPREVNAAAAKQRQHHKRATDVEMAKSRAANKFTSLKRKHATEEDEEGGTQSPASKRNRPDHHMHTDIKDDDDDVADDATLRSATEPAERWPMYEPGANGMATPPAMADVPQGSYQGDLALNEDVPDELAHELDFSDLEGNWDLPQQTLMDQSSYKGPYHYNRDDAPMQSRNTHDTSHSFLDEAYEHPEFGKENANCTSPQPSVVQASGAFLPRFGDTVASGAAPASLLEDRPVSLKTPAVLSQARTFLSLESLRTSDPPASAMALDDLSIIGLRGPDPASAPQPSPGRTRSRRIRRRFQPAMSEYQDAPASREDAPPPSPSVNELSVPPAVFTWRGENAPTPDITWAADIAKTGTDGQESISRPEKCPIPTCEYNGRGFARKYDLNRHVLTHYKGEMVCGFCASDFGQGERTFSRVDVFKRHLTSVHRVEQAPPNSGKETSKTTSTNTQAGLARCSMCSGRFATAQDFYDHLDQCTLRTVADREEMRSYTCPHVECASAGVAFSCWEDMERHTRDRHDDSALELFKCPHPGCGWSSSRKDKLLDHQRRTHGDELSRRGKP